jgi:hypothetical protein
MKRYKLAQHGFSPSTMEEDPTGIFVRFSDSADRIERLEKALKALVHNVGTSVICHDWCEALKHEDDPTPNPYCECGMCDLIDRADEAQDLLDELCTCTPSKHFVFCEGGDKCICGDRIKHEDGCAAITVE